VRSSLTVQVLDPSLIIELEESGLAARLAGLVHEQASQPSLLPLLTVPPGVDDDGLSRIRITGGRGPRTRDDMGPAGDGVLIGDAVRGTDAVIQFKLPAHEGGAGRPLVLVGLVGVEAPPDKAPTVVFVMLLTDNGELKVEWQTGERGAVVRTVPFGSGVVRRQFPVVLLGSEASLSVSALRPASPTNNVSYRHRSNSVVRQAKPHPDKRQTPRLPPPLPPQVRAGRRAPLWSTSTPPGVDVAVLRSPSLSVFPVVYSAPGTDPRVEVSRASLLGAPVEWTLARLRSLTGPPLPPTATLRVRAA
jgi:hypothetical protein